ncbi:MAG TPA: hypothetical protein VF223_05020 [Trebonia sp.]
MDDAAAGQRGTRAIASADLEEFLRARWGVRPATAAPDLGGSVNLNLLITDGRSPWSPTSTSSANAREQTISRSRCITPTSTSATSPATQRSSPG